MNLSAEVEFGKRLSKAFDLAARAASICAASTRQLAALLWEPIRELYERAGKPYGPFDEDMKRWWRDQWPKQD